MARNISYFIGVVFMLLFLLVLCNNLPSCEARSKQLLGTEKGTTGLLISKEDSTSPKLLASDEKRHINGVPAAKQKFFSGRDRVLQSVPSPTIGH